MPEISRFFGIVIKMFFDDHNPPHFHAEYGGDLALIDIRTLAVFSGRLPPCVNRSCDRVGNASSAGASRRLGQGTRAGGAPEDRALGMRPANHWLETLAPLTQNGKRRDNHSREA